MELSVIGQAMNQQAKVTTLEKVNISLLKTNNEQAQQQTAQLLESVTPDVTNVEGSKGSLINTTA